jgi:hypothetical protein
MAEDASLATPLLAAAGAAAGKPAGATTRAPAAPSASRLLFLELSRVHPLLHIGVGLLVFAAQTALVCAAVLLAALWPYLRPAATAVAAQLDSDYSFSFLPVFAAQPAPLPPLLPRVAPQLAAFLLHAFTIGVASALLESHYVRCVSKPSLRTTMQIASLAGGASLIYASLLARNSPALSAVELGATLCTAAYSVMVRARAWRAACGSACRCAAAAAFRGKV